MQIEAGHEARSCSLLVVKVKAGVPYMMTLVSANTVTELINVTVLTGIILFIF